MPSKIRMAGFCACFVAFRCFNDIGKYIADGGAFRTSVSLASSVLESKIEGNFWTEMFVYRELQCSSDTMFFSANIDSNVYYLECQSLQLIKNHIRYYHTNCFLARLKGL